MAKLSNKNLLGIAVTFGLLTTLLVYNYLQGAVNKQTTQESVSVILAKADIPPKTEITADMVQEIKMPPEYLQPGAVQDIKTVVGVVTRERILAGEQITERRLVFEGKAVGFTGIIPRDKRAVTIAVTEVTGVAGFIKAGDHVDIIVTFDAGAVGDNVSQVILQNIQVLAANHEAENGVVTASAKDAPKDAIKTTTVTVAVTPDEAAKMTLADEKGKIRLALRPYLPTDGLVLTASVTPKDMVGIHASPVQNNGSATAPPAPSLPPSPPSPPASQAPARSDADGKGIQMIRGTKVERVPVN